MGTLTSFFLQNPSRMATVQTTPAANGNEKIVVKAKHGFVFLLKEEIQWIEAEGQYSLIHCQAETIRVRKSITEFEEDLDSQVFYRINRSAVLNLNHVRILRPWRKGDYEVIMSDGSTLHWSRSFNDRLDELLGRIHVAQKEV